MEFYKQTTDGTGATCCLLMVLNEKKGMPLKREQEFLLWQQTALIPVRSSSIYALSLVAKNHGIRSEVWVGNKELEYPDYRFKRYKKTQIDDAKFLSELHLKQAIKADIKIVEKEFSLEEINQVLLDGRYVVLRINVGIIREQKSLSRYVLITNWDAQREKYSLLDPQEGADEVTGAQLREAFETLTTKKRRDHRALLLG